MPTFGIPLATLLLAMLSIQLGASVAKQLFAAHHPATVTLLRTGMAAALLWLIFRPWRFPLKPGEWLHVFLYGLALGLMNLFFYLSLQRIPLGIAVAIEFVGPLGLAILYSRRILDGFWILMASCGIALLSPLSLVSAQIDSLGIFFAALAGLFWAIYIAFGQRVSRRLPGHIVSSYGMTVAALVVLPWGLYFAKIETLSMNLLLVGSVVAVLSSLVPYTLEMYALRFFSPQSFGILMSIEPAIASLFGLLILDEHLKSSQWLAIMLIMVASAGTAIRTKSPSSS